ncbi:hypothetical protein HGM15179_009317 [Zosterops borbonicus]|uniref:Immunoglobulin domain-containing protein n=1 Tax=Zosterops borbonicus TaxID=364589 RepID=A0A8K1GGP2_9PASS|nr:hypothetical protein HGM15179_009317 [Zosterops borbonicus]
MFLVPSKQLLSLLKALVNGHCGLAYADVEPPQPGCVCEPKLPRAHIYCKEVVGLVGENITFPVQIDQKIEEILWRKNKHKVVEWEVQNTPIYYDPFRNRSVLMESGSLTIFNLEKDDAGPYELQYRDSVEDHSLDFALVVLDSLPEPIISCNASNGELVLNCIAHFQVSLNYAWKLSNDPHSYPNQVLSIPLKNVDPITNATCTIKFSQTERSSEISLNQCLPEEKGDSPSKRTRGGLIGAVIAVIILVGSLVFLFRRGIIKCGAGRAAQNNTPVNGSGEQEQLFPGNSQQQPNSEGAACSNTVRSEDEEPEADRALNEDDSALNDKQIVKNGVNQEVGTVLSWERERGAQPSCASRAWQDVWLQRDISLSHLLKNLPASEGDADSCEAEHVSKEKADGREIYLNSKAAAGVRGELAVKSSQDPSSSTAHTDGRKCPESQASFNGPGVQHKPYRQYMKM